LALAFDDPGFIEYDLIGAEGTAEPEVVEVLQALAAEDGSTVFLEAPGQETMVAFPAPPLKDGLGRTVFLRTVSCYEMPGPPRPGGAAPEADRTREGTAQLNARAGRVFVHEGSRLVVELRPCLCPHRGVVIISPWCVLKR